MKINGNEKEQVILAELGSRIKHQRMRLNLTQAQLARRCGISPSTQVRIENGEDSKISNYIKLMNALNMAGNLDLIVPEVQPDYKAIYEGKGSRMRVKHSKHKAPVRRGRWKWGDDK